MTHTWGPLGSWSGQTVYVFAGERAGLEQFAYDLKLAHRPPCAGLGGGGGLPIQFGAADFRIVAAGGTILFDPTLGRVGAFEERFQVRGQAAVAALGVVTSIAMEEVQSFTVRL